MDSDPHSQQSRPQQRGRDCCIKGTIAIRDSGCEKWDHLFRIADWVIDQRNLIGVQAQEAADGLAAVEKDGKIGFINMKGALVIPYQFVHRTNDRPDIVFKDGRCVMANGNGQMGVIDRNGEWVGKPQYEKVDLTESGIFATTSNSKLLLSNKGEIIQNDLIVKVEPLTCNVQLKEKDGEGRWRLQDVEMRMDYYVYYTFAYNNRCGLMDKDGNRLTEPVYSKIEALNEHLFSFYLLDGETQFVKSL